MGKTGGKMFVFKDYLLTHAAVRGGTCAFTLKIVNTLIKNSSRADIESTRGQAGSCRARPVNVDDDLEDIRWIRELGGEKLPAASYALLPNLKKGLFFAIGEESRIFGACFLHSSAQMCLYLTPDIFEAIINIHRPCPTRTGLTVGCFYVEIEGLSSRELFLIIVLTIFNVKAQVPPRTAA